MATPWPSRPTSPRPSTGATARAGPQPSAHGPAAGFQVTGTTTYKTPDSYPVSVAIADVGGSTATATTTATISSAPPPAQLLGVGAAPGHDPLVGAYAPNGDLLLRFRAYPKRMTSGVRVATGDVNGDGAADVITAPGSQGRALVEVFSGIDGHRLLRFRAFVGQLPRRHLRRRRRRGRRRACGHRRRRGGGRPAARARLFGRDRRTNRRSSSRGAHEGAARACASPRATWTATAAPRSRRRAGRGAGSAITIFRADRGSASHDCGPTLRARRGLFLAMGDLNGDKLADLAAGRGRRRRRARGRRQAPRRVPAVRHRRPRPRPARRRSPTSTPTERRRSRSRGCARARTLRAFTAGTWTRVGGLLGGHPPPGAVYLG